MNSSRPLLAYFGHHKAASDWIHNIAQDACHEMGLNYVYLHNARQFDHALDAYVGREKIDFLTYANADLAELNGCLDQIKGFHVVRDPRDIAVSAYFSHRFSHTTSDFPRLHAHRENLCKASKDEGLILEFEFGQTNFENMVRWNYSLPNILELKMEQMIREPADAFCRAFAFLGLLEGQAHDQLPKISKDAILGIVDKYGFMKQSGGRPPGQEDPKNHYRKGVPGDWKNHFTDEHKKIFKEKYNPLLMKLGYEKDENW